LSEIADHWEERPSLVRLGLRIATAAAAAAPVVVALVLFSPLARGDILDGYLLFVGALVLLALVHATRTATPAAEESLYERALRRRRRGGARPPELARIEREVVLSSMSSFDFHMRMRPLLREVAAHRLATRRGLELDTGSPEVRGLLGEELWELLRPERRPPADRFAPGLPVAGLRRTLDALERI
jgi:hypothetical protein